MLQLPKGRSLSILIFLMFVLSSLYELNAQTFKAFEEFQFSGYKPSFDYDEIEESKFQKIEGPDDLKGYLNRAINSLEINDLELAKRDLNYILSYREDIGAVYFYRALCYKSLYKIDSAISDLNKVLTLQQFEFFLPTHIELGYIQIQFYRDYDKAKVHFDLASKLNPEDYRLNYSY